MNDKNDSVEAFAQVKQQDLGKLISILKDRSPRCGNMYNIALMLKNNSSEVRMYALKGDLSSNCWILCAIRREDYDYDYTVSAPINPVITPEIKSAFAATEAIKWNLRYMFCALDPTIALMVAEISAIVNKNATAISPTVTYYMDPAHAHEMDITLPEGLEIREMNGVAGVNFLVNNWKYRLEGSREFVQRITENAGSCGIYKDGEPISGLLLYPYGLLGMLYTPEKHRGKGLAQLCMKSLARKMVEKGMIPMSTAEVKNQSSRVFHEKCGFTLSHESVFIVHNGSKW